MRMPRDNDIPGHVVISIFKTSYPETLLQTSHFALTQKFEIGNRAYGTNGIQIRVQQELVGAFAMLQDVTEYAENNPLPFL